VPVLQEPPVSIRPVCFPLRAAQRAALPVSQASPVRAMSRLPAQRNGCRVCRKQ